MKITLQPGSPDHPEINQRIICQKELYKVDPVAKEKPEANFVENNNRENVDCRVQQPCNFFSFFLFFKAVPAPAPVFIYLFSAALAPAPQRYFKGLKLVFRPQKKFIRTIL